MLTTRPRTEALLATQRRAGDAAARETAGEGVAASDRIRIDIDTLTQFVVKRHAVHAEAQAEARA